MAWFCSRSTVAGRAAAFTPHDRTNGGALTATRATGVLHILGQRVTKLFRVFRGKVDLVAHTVQTELDGLFRLGAVEVVDERDEHLLCHLFPPAGAYTNDLVRGMPRTEDFV